MDRRYQQYLYNKYEPLYRGHNKSLRDTCMCWGFEVGNGWFDLINNLSYSLCSDWLQAKRDYEFIAGRVGQLKYAGGSNINEPWNKIITIEDVNDARIKMIEEYDKVPEASQVKEKYGTLRFYVWGATEEQYAKISFAETMSATICEVCGNRGKMNRSGWFACRCKKHR